MSSNLRRPVVCLSNGTSSRFYWDRMSVMELIISFSVILRQSAFNNLSRALWITNYFDVGSSSTDSYVRCNAMEKPNISEDQFIWTLFSIYSIFGKSIISLSSSMFSMNFWSIIEKRSMSFIDPKSYASILLLYKSLFSATVRSDLTPGLESFITRLDCGFLARFLGPLSFSM